MASGTRRPDGTGGGVSGGPGGQGGSLGWPWIVGGVLLALLMLGIASLEGGGSGGAATGFSLPRAKQVSAPPSVASPRRSRSPGRTRDRGARPGLSGMISGDDTLALAWVADLDRTVAFLDGAGGSVSSLLPGMGGDDGGFTALLNPAKRGALLGWDPLQAAAWRRAGIDPSMGMAIGLDRRFADPVKTPVLYVVVTDEAAVAAWLSKVLKEPVEMAADGYIKIGDRAVATFAKHGAMYVVVAGALTRDDHGWGVLQQIASGAASPLAKSAKFRPVTAGWAVGSAGLFAYVDVAGLVAAKGGDSRSDRLAAYYASLAPVVSMFMGPGAGGVRALLSDDGSRVAHNLTHTAASPPPFPRYVPRSGWSAAKLHVNLESVLDGVEQLMPPDSRERKFSAMSSDVEKFENQNGLSRRDLASKFTGHVLFAAKNELVRSLKGDGLPTEPWLLVLGVSDGAAVDALVDVWMAKLKSMGTETRPEGGGWLVSFDTGFSVAVKRAGQRLFLANSASSIQRAIAGHGGSNLGKVDAGRHLGASTVLGVVVTDPGKALAPLLEGEESMASLVGSLLGGQSDLGWGLSVKQGLVSIDSNDMMVPMLAAVMVPAFMKYTRRSKTSEATTNLRKMFDSSVNYFVREHATREGLILPRHFPESTGLSPGRDFCNPATSSDGKWIPKKQYWQDRTWQALNFALSDPHYYSYEYASEGTEEGASFTVRAIGDLNCDGVYSTFERVGSVDASLNVIGGGGVYVENELE